MKKRQTADIFVRIPAEWRALLEQIAEHEEEGNISRVVREAIRGYLEVRELDLLQEAKDNRTWYKHDETPVV